MKNNKQIIKNYQKKHIQAEILDNKCFGKYFIESCAKCHSTYEVWCTNKRSCSKCGTTIYGRHYYANQHG